MPHLPTAEEKHTTYKDTLARIDALLQGETDWIAAMATVACELHHSFEHFHWTGFYRHVEQNNLIIGPYQGHHGCLHIHFTRGVCGAAALQRATQLIENVHNIPHHIACSSTTVSEIVVPLVLPNHDVLAVLDVDSDDHAAFDEIDQHYLEDLCQKLVEQFGHTTQR